jgi:hypothetical protein
VIVETLDAIRGARKQSHSAGLMEKTGVFDDRAVAIEKDGAMALGSHRVSVIGLRVSARR